MKTILAMSFAATLALGAVATAPTQAQTSDRVYDNGTVWRVAAIETKPGMFNAYMKYLSTTWRAIQEAGIKRGDVVSYKVLVDDAPRDHEPNLYLMIEYKNMAVFDRSLKELDDQTAATFGSTAKAQDAAISREALRTPRGQDTLRELKFIN
jgi:hypothetical protein